MQLHQRLSALLDELVSAQHQERLAAKATAAAAHATGTDGATPAPDQLTRSAVRIRLQLFAAVQIEQSHLMWSPYCRCSGSCVQIPWLAGYAVSSYTIDGCNALL